MRSNEKVTEAVRVLLASSQMTQADLAPAMNLSRSSVSLKLGGRSVWTLNDLDGIAGYFKISPGDLFMGARVTSRLPIDVS